MNQPQIRVSQDYLVYQPREQGRLPIAEADWQRLKKMVAAIPDSGDSFENAAYLFAGLAGSGFLSLTGVLTAMQRPPWIIPATLSFSVACAVIAGVLYRVCRREKNDTRVHSTQAIEEMGSIEQGFDKSSPPATPPTTGRALPSVAPRSLEKGRDSDEETEPDDPQFDAIFGKELERVAAQAEARHSRSKREERPRHPFRVGDRVRHRKFGLGKIMELHGQDWNSRATVEFDDHEYGVKMLLLAYAGLELVQKPN